MVHCMLTTFNELDALCVAHLLVSMTHSERNSRGVDAICLLSKSESLLTLETQS